MKIICIGRNYSEHAKELNNDIPSEPVFFMKPETALLKETDFYLPDFTNDLHHEIELVLKKNNKLLNNQPFKIDLKKQQIIYTIWIKTFVFLFVLISLILFKKPSQLFWRGVSLGVLIQLPFIIMFDILTILNMNLLFC